MSHRNKNKNKNKKPEPCKTGYLKQYILIIIGVVVLILFLANWNEIFSKKFGLGGRTQKQIMLPICPNGIDYSGSVPKCKDSAN